MTIGGFKFQIANNDSLKLPKILCVREIVFNVLQLQKKELFMATVSATKMVSGFQFKPGAKAHWAWYNAHSDTVYSFSVQPYVLTGSDGKAEVTKVNYYIQGNPQARQVHIEVTNTGSTTINYDLFMSEIHV
jgi:hypothetical protein